MSKIVDTLQQNLRESKYLAEKTVQFMLIEGELDG